MITKVISSYKKAYSGLPRNIWLLSFVILINRSGAMVLAFLTLYFTTQRGFSITEAGQMLSIFGVGAVLGTSLGGKLSDQYSPINLQIISFISTGVLFFGFEFVEEKSTLMLYMLVVSFFAELFRPANSVTISYFSSEKDRTRAFGLNRLAINIGMAIGPAVGGFLAAHNYNYLFRINGTTCLFAGLLIYMLFRKETIQIENVDKETSKQESPLRDKFFIFFLFFGMLNAICFFQVFNTLPIFLKQDYGFQENIIGLLFTINGLLIVLFEMILMSKVERFRDIHVITVGVLLTGLGLSAILLGASVYILYFSVAIWTFGEMLSLPFMTSYTSKLAKPHNRGRYLGMYAAVFSVAHIIAPTFGTHMYETYGGTIYWLSIGVLACVSAAGMYTLSRIKQIEVPKTSTSRLEKRLSP